VLSRAVHKKQRGRRFLTALATVGLVASTLLTASTALAVHDEGVFELEGNAVAGNTGVGTGTDPANPQSQPAGGEDWDVVYAGTSTAENTSFVTDTTILNTLAGAGDSILFGGTTKDIHDLPSWAWKQTTSTSVQDKADIENAYAAQYDVSGEDLLYFGADRFSNSGDTVMGFWFFKGPVGVSTLDAGGDGTFTGSHTARTATSRGDILVVADFRAGGKAPSIQVYEWVASGGSASTNLDQIGGSDNPAGCTESPPEGGKLKDPIPPVADGDPFCATANQFIVTSPWPFLAKDNSGGTSGTGGTTTKFGVAEFMEGGINLTALGLGDSCFSTFMAETRASHSVTSTLSDFALGGFGSCESGITTTPSDENGVAIGADGIDLGTDGSVLVTDSADIDVSGINQWDATLDFYLCGPDEGLCDDSGTLISTHEIDEASANPFVSDAAEVTAAGEYCWAAIFTSHTTGVPNNSDVSEGECFTVNPVTPMIFTVADDTAVVDTAIDDTATLGGTANQPGDPVIDPTTAGDEAGGTITFTLYGPSDTADCSAGQLIGTSVVEVDGDGDYLASTGDITGTLTPTAVGKYWWIAEYSGDPPNTEDATGTCGDENESTTITGTASLMTAQDWLPNDSATVTGDTNLSGTLTFQLYSGNNCGDTSGEAIDGQSYEIILDNETSPFTDGTSNTTFIVKAADAGSYSWLVTYVDATLDSPDPVCESSDVINFVE
jgi:hypothetical protein